jgi:ferrochelatase
VNPKANGHSIGVVLFQLGGPDSLQAVEPFLYNLFSDPDIIDFPLARLARPTLARLIASRRAKKVAEHYRSIGGHSPIRKLTERQAKALEGELRKTLEARVFVAMRYWHPLTDEAVRQLRAHDCRELVLLPLYPQYSTTTTRSSLNEWRRRFQPVNGTRVTVIEDFCQHPAYIDAVVEKINEGLARFGRGKGPFGTGPCEPVDVHLVFSAHGVPKRVIEAGDPYQAQVEATTKLVMERGGWRNPHLVCYQSRVGPGEWLKPSLQEALHGLAAAGKKRLLVIPISFVTDHIETLSEIDIEARAEAGRLGLGQFEVMPALNDSPTFIRALAELVRREVGI